mmetsp:Transcript_7191/g.18635  ORF Transcript_7191/g.18635 Transcript_7191/m.18635 type:complete len:234 (-) Transcript_7191:794-1495(-)
MRKKMQAFQCERRAIKKKNLIIVMYPYFTSNRVSHLRNMRVILNTLAIFKSLNRRRIRRSFGTLATCELVSTLNKSSTISRGRIETRSMRNQLRAYLFATLRGVVSTIPSSFTYPSLKLMTMSTAKSTSITLSIQNIGWLRWLVSAKNASWNGVIHAVYARSTTMTGSHTPINLEPGRKKKRGRAAVVFKLDIPSSSSSSSEPAESYTVFTSPFALATAVPASLVENFLFRSG